MIMSPKLQSPASRIPHQCPEVSRYLPTHRPLVFTRRNVWDVYCQHKVQNTTGRPKCASVPTPRCVTVVSQSLIVHLYNSLLQCVRCAFQRTRRTRGGWVGGCVIALKRIINCRIKVSLNYAIFLKNKKASWTFQKTEARMPHGLLKPG